MRRSVGLGMAWIYIVIAVVLIGGCAAHKAAAHREQGAIHFTAGNLDASKTEYSASLQYEPSSEAEARIGNILTKQGKWLEALDHLNTVKDDPSYEKQAVADLAVCYLKLGSWPEAAEYSVRTIELDPANHAYVVSTASIWPKLTNEPRLLGWLERIRDAQPTLHYGWAYIGNYYFRTNQLVKAKEAYEKALSIFPRSYPVLMRYGSILIQQKEAEKAQQQFKTAISIQDDAEAHYGHAGALFLGGQMDEALRELMVVLKSKQDFGEAHALASQIYAHKGIYQKALEHGKKAVAAMPKNAGLLKIIGAVAMKLKDYVFAANIYGTLITIDEKNALAHVNLGICWRMAKNPQVAQQSFAKALMIDPSLAVAHREMGMLYFETGYFQQSRISLMQAVAIAPEDAQAQLYLGLANFELGPSAYEIAEPPLLKAAAMLPADPTPWTKLSVISAEKRRNTESLDRLEKAIDLGFNDPAFFNHKVFNNVRWLNRFRQLQRRVQPDAVLPRRPKPAAPAMPALVPLVPTSSPAMPQLVPLPNR